jgi:DNA-binding CsgD family transcriptional regulator
MDWRSAAPVWSVLTPPPAPAAKDSDRSVRGDSGRASDSPPPELLDLARRLIAWAASERGELTSGANEEVMLDVEADGVRCVLISTAPAACTGPQLSPREQEIVRMVSNGYPTKTIAAVLEISTWTVSTHLRRVFAKLGVRTRAAMVARALEEGLSSEPGATLQQFESKDSAIHFTSQRPGRPRA